MSHNKIASHPSPGIHAADKLVVYANAFSHLGHEQASGYQTSGGSRACTGGMLRPIPIISRVNRDTDHSGHQFTLKEVNLRIQSPQTQRDMLGKLVTLHQEHPDKVSLREVTSAIWINLYVASYQKSARTKTQQLIDCSTAGHDVLATTLRALFYHLAQNPAIARKLQDEILSTAAGFDDSCVVPDLVVSKLPYLYVTKSYTLSILILSHQVAGTATGICR